MKIAAKIAQKQKDPFGAPPVTIVCIGDSVTQGCFESNYAEGVGFYGPCEPERSYSAHLGRLLHTLCPCAQVNIINSGIGGDMATGGLARFDRDVTPFSPDLVIVGFALNDCGHGLDGLATYKEALGGIFDRVAALGAECICLTPNHMNDRISPYLSDPLLRQTAEAFTHNCLEAYVRAAGEVAREHGVAVCDVYAAWESWREAGVDTTELLANRLNHPLRELHEMTAYKLLATIFEG